MALVQRNFHKVSALLSRYNFRSHSTERDIKKSVFISQSKDIFTNLALEDWLYRNFDFTNHHVLMLWQSDPCVVIGRYQNPWLEANITELGTITKDGVQLARRNSGGGSVYHDHGNLNLTFFTSRENYSRKYNLEVVTRALFREYGAKLEISPREDLILRDKSVSGTAAKLGRPSAYHHCTLLVNSNKVNLNQALQNLNLNIDTNATKSTKSKIINLCEQYPKIKVPDLYKVIGWEYLRTHALTVKDGGMELANQQKGFQMINPTEHWFPGISHIRNDLASWEWCYGRTPKFQVSRSIAIPEHLSDVSEYLQAKITVENGKITEISLSAEGFSGNMNVISGLIGHKFSDDALSKLEWSIRDKFATNCTQQVMTSV